MYQLLIWNSWPTCGYINHGGIPAFKGSIFVNCDANSRISYRFNGDSTNKISKFSYSQFWFCWNDIIFFFFLIWFLGYHLFCVNDETQTVHCFISVAKPSFWKKNVFLPHGDTLQRFYRYSNYVTDVLLHLYILAFWW